MIALKIFVASLAPLIWLQYFREREGFRTPARAVWLAIATGVLVAYLALLAQQFLSRSPNISFQWFLDLGIIKALTLDGLHNRDVIDSFIHGGVIEESLKLLGTLAIFCVLKKSLQPWNLAIIALGIAAGFAITENTAFNLKVEHWKWNSLFRGINSLHIFFGAIMGSFLALGLIGRKSVFILMLPLALIVPILLHGSYNYAVYLNKEISNIGTQAYIFIIGIVITSALMAIGLTYRAKLPDSLRPDIAMHFWLRRQYLRKWSWQSLAFLLILVGILDLSVKLTNIHFIGVVALFQGTLFWLRGRAAALEIRTLAET
jgi:RsiW-degrading membrane proteinase PrsW (M82 family)